MSVRITEEKNLAYSDQPEPLTSEQVTQQIRPRNASRKVDPSEVELGLLVATEGEPRVEVESAKGRGNGARLKIRNFAVGRHAFPPAMEVRGLEALGNRADKARQPLEVEGFAPEHLDLDPTPAELPRELRRPAFIQGLPERKARRPRGNPATTVFPPENRSVFFDTRYPWSTCGRVDTPGGFASGVMVGPRHLLTVSHTIQWNADGSAGWVRFRPSFFDGSAPFGEAWGAVTYFKHKVTGPTIDWIEGMYDYVVVVLNWRIGDLTGWMGGRGYTDSWDGGAYWSHIGYPGDLTAGNRPTFEKAISLDGSWWQVDSHEAMAHQGDVWPGQSGGPFFGWWSGDVGPRVVAVQSSQNPSENNASGGQDLVDLIIQARNEHP